MNREPYDRRLSRTVWEGLYIVKCLCHFTEFLFWCWYRKIMKCVVYFSMVLGFFYSVKMILFNTKKFFLYVYFIFFLSSLKRKIFNKYFQNLGNYFYKYLDFVIMNKIKNRFFVFSGRLQFNKSLNYFAKFNIFFWFHLTLLFWLRVSLF